MGHSGPRTYVWFHPRRAVGRLVVATAVVAMVGLLLPSSLSWGERAVAAWDAGALSLLILVLSTELAKDPVATRRRAAAADPGRTAVWVIVLLANGVTVLGAAIMSRNAHGIAGNRAELLAGLCMLAVVLAWTLTHTGFTLRYAHLYYRDDEEGVGGLSFPGGRPPSDFDFAYFSFTIGMCFQVSDVSVSSPRIRRAVLAHAVMSFAYNTVILAVALNLVFGRLSGG
jgi:uncharacterized membrane protein